MTYEYKTMVFDRNAEEQETELDMRLRARRGRELALAGGWEHMNEFCDVGHIAVWLRKRVQP